MQKAIFFLIASALVGSALYMVSGRSTSQALPPEDSTGEVTELGDRTHAAREHAAGTDFPTYGDSHGITTYFGDADEEETRQH